ncbi:HAD-IA family hydrolase [Carnobacterium gallinarum]|uniref:HAD-IA family hydrolase n=1 Tax=Carnobacterium gallinarum TaxID=2749 RepID=UPI000550AB17|nr:HAD-IA family hydrolase [Carnobacterium gallinarum]
MQTFIWDLDGTLVNSYNVILQSLNETFSFYSIPYNQERVKDFILKQSVVDLLKQKSSEFSIPYEELKNFFSEKSQSKNNQVTLIAGATEVLSWTKENGINNFMYTHKGANTFDILKNLGISDYFTEILTSADGFKRKPDPEAIQYLIDKYQLVLDQTYYIGDRSLDVGIAQNAGINSLNLTQPDSDHNVKISTLTDIFKQEGIL